MGKVNKNARILDIFIRLSEGKILNKAEEAIRFGVDERSIQRDMDDIRAFLKDNSAEYGTLSEKSVVYDHEQKGYKMIGNEDAVMSNGEILAVSKILLESRAFPKTEIAAILDKLLNGCASKESKQLVSDAVRNEKYHYVELHHKTNIEDQLWNLNEHIQKQNLLELIYEKQVASKETVSRVVEPVAVLFSEYYFYLNAYIVEQDEKGNYVHQYDYPAIFRIDRIKDFHEIGVKYKSVYSSRFEEGEYRKKVQFMYAGNLHKCRFRYMGRNKEAVLDRFPTAVLKSEDETGYIFEAETYGRGIMMWLLSQGINVEVLGPEDFRERMRREVREMLEKYEGVGGMYG